MKQRYTRRFLSATLVALVAVLASGMAVVVAQTGPPQEEIFIPAVNEGEQAAGDASFARAAAASTNCRKSYTSGTGQAAFNWCFSDDGNIVSIENSAGLEHVGIGTITEGWCVSANGTKRGQTNGSAANTGLELPTYPGPAKVAHLTTDGDLRVQQRFVQQKANRQINIIMEVENLTDQALQNVYLTRFVDADISNSTFDDITFSGTRSVTAYVPGSARLELIPQSTQFFANSMLWADFEPNLDEECYDATADAVTEQVAGDRSMGVMVQIGTIFPGESKQVKFSYRISI